MHEPADQEDGDAEHSGERVAGQRPGSLAELQPRTRSQAALVRESLVRCPGAADGGE
ncbi:MAG TPA: hypothetical protein VHM72_10305 [Solirubrobacteraceae bacterium]|nr:hypothetical protein [Solirubrobacteraceae bacterium]